MDLRGFFVFKIEVKKLDDKILSERHSGLNVFRHMYSELTKLLLAAACQIVF